MNRYNETATHNYGLGYFATTKGVLYEQWRQGQDYSTWGSLSFEEWDKKLPNSQMVTWESWVKANRSKAKE